MRPIYTVLLLVLCLTSKGVLIDCANILLMPYPFNSHVFQMLEVAEELGSTHKIHMLLSPKYPLPDRVNKSRIPLIFYDAPDPEWYDIPMSEDIEGQWVEDLIENPVDFVTDLQNTDEYWISGCSNPLGDEKLFKKLKSMKFDFALIDGFLGVRCYYILAYRLGIPYATLSDWKEPWLSRSPALPSFVPFHLATTYTEKMNFWQRLANFWKQVKYYNYIKLSPNSDSLVSKYAPEKPFVTLNYLTGQSEIWLVATNMPLDYPMPTMPNVIPIGGLTSKPAKPLTAKFDKLVKDAKSGVIVITFGSLLKAIPQKVVDKLVAAFRKIDQTVIWKLDNGNLVPNPPKNVKVYNWIPQNDLLGHPNVKLFITHAGNNGMFESVYHAVPMIAFPVFGDQPYNAERMQYRGYGIILSLYTFTPTQLVDNINKIFTDLKFSARVKQGSKVLKSQPLTPKQTAAFWINHVIENGADHLKSHALKLPWYQFWMVDIFVFFLAVTSVAMSISIKLICYLFKIIHSRSVTKKEKIQ